jgi:hypothetical protein
MLGNAELSMAAKGDAGTASACSRAALCAQAAEVMALIMHAETITCVKIGFVFSVGFFMLVFCRDK